MLKEAISRLEAVYSSIEKNRNPDSCSLPEYRLVAAFLAIEALEEGRGMELSAEDKKALIEALKHLPANASALRQTQEWSGKEPEKSRKGIEIPLGALGL